MKNQIFRLAFIRKRERKSLLLVISILMLSSFSDDLAIAVRANLGLSPENTTIISFQNPNAQRAMGSEEIESKTASLHFRDTLNLSLTDNEKSLDSIQEGIKKLPRKLKKPLAFVRVNPNDPKIDDLISIGIPSKVAHTWKKFSDTGAKFYDRQELLKIYGMNEELLEKIKDKMIFPQRIKANPKDGFVSIYVNSADASQFSKISGIGPTLSGRIVKFRDRLGGFHSIEQLNEVYGIDPALIEKNKDAFIIDKEVQKININTSNEEQLAAHIYCTYRIARAIINYRKQHGSFTGPEDLRELRIIDSEWIAKISPYLDY